MTVNENKEPELNVQVPYLAAIPLVFLYNTEFQWAFIDTED